MVPRMVPKDSESKSMMFQFSKTVSTALKWHFDQILQARSRENLSKMRRNSRKVKFYHFFGFTAIRFRLTDAMRPIQRALESPDLEEHFQ